MGGRRGLRVASIIGGGAVREVRVNAVIGNGPPEWVRERAAAAVAAGYGTLKLKVAAASLAEDRRRVQAAREAAPDVRLRLDANGGWDTATAREAIASLAHYELEYVEQPVPARDLEGLARLRAEGTCLIAADESVADAAEAERVLDSGAVDVLVAQADALGGIRRASTRPRRVLGGRLLRRHHQLRLQPRGGRRAAPCAAVDAFAARGGFAHGSVRPSTLQRTSSQARSSRTKGVLACAIGGRLGIEPTRPPSRQPRRATGSRCAAEGGAR